MYKVVLIYTRPSQDVPFFGTPEMTKAYAEFQMGEEANRQATQLIAEAPEMKHFETLTSEDGLTFTQNAYWTTKEAFFEFDTQYNSLFRFRHDIRLSYGAKTGHTSVRADEDGVELPE